jgi:hypothetical protein
MHAGSRSDPKSPKDKMKTGTEILRSLKLVAVRLMTV